MIKLVEAETSWWVKLFTNLYVNNMLDVSLSTKFITKQQSRKSLTSGGIISSMDGVSFMTLNIAAGCTTDISNSDDELYVKNENFNN